MATGIVDPLETHSRRTNLALLGKLRVVVLASLTLLILVARLVLDIPLPVLPLALGLLLLAIAAAAALARVRKPHPVASDELLWHAVADVAILSWLLWFSEGTENPLVVGFLVLIAYAAIALPPPQVAVLAAIELACALGLYAGHQELPLGAAQDNALFENVGLAALVLGIPLTAWAGIHGMSAHRSELTRAARARERQLRDENLIALASLAAGAAHEMASPLSTAKLLVGELRDDPALGPEGKSSAEVLERQIDACRDSLQRIVAASRPAERTTPEPVAADRLVADVVERFQLLRRETDVALRFKRAPAAPLVETDPGFMQALLNLLNNAADASGGGIEVVTDWNDRELKVRILDHGPGVAPHVRASLGQEFTTTKPGGLGLGLFLTHATIDRLGGQVVIYDRKGGGTDVRVTLPLKARHHSGETT